MLTMILAHAGQPPEPHDLWSAWNLDPVLIVALLGAAWVYRRGMTGGRQRPLDRLRARSYAGALLALGVALVSPLDALSSALASAHMVQHVVLVLVAAPLLALSAPSSMLLRGSPLALRQASGRWRRRLGLTANPLPALRHPATVWLLHVGALWFWHAAVPYGAALDSTFIHVLEHATFLLTGVLFWHVVIGSRGAGRVPNGVGVLLVFAMAMQSVFLSLLLTFATTPWYAGYATTTTPWGLEHLADQQLAGVIMWIPAGLVYLAAALALLVTWIQSAEAPSRSVSPARLNRASQRHTSGSGGRT